MDGKLIRSIAVAAMAALVTLCVVACSRVADDNAVALSEQSQPEKSDVDETSANDTASSEPDTPPNQNVDDRPLAEDRTSSASALAKGDINFDDLKFDIEKGQPFEDAQLNDRVRSLDGKKVKLSGYILPASTYKQTGIERFVLVRDNQECCFGPGASLFDCVYVQMVGGNTAEFAVRPVTVEGEFKIDTESYRYPGGIGPDGSTHLAVFEIEGVSVR